MDFYTDEQLSLLLNAQALIKASIEADYNGTNDVKLSFDEFDYLTGWMYYTTFGAIENTRITPIQLLYELEKAWLA